MVIELAETDVTDENATENPNFNFGDEELTLKVSLTNAVNNAYFSFLNGSMN